MKEEQGFWEKFITLLIALLAEIAIGGLALKILVMLAGFSISFWTGVMGFFCMKLIYGMLQKTEID